MLITILSFLFMFAAVVLSHEFGHYIFAKRGGIRVHEFALGFGPKIFSFIKNNTQYCLNLIPVGGYVRLAGILEFGEEEPPEEKITPEEEKYYTKPVGSKFKTIAGGPFMNIVLAFLILYAIFISIGVPTSISKEIGLIVPGSPAAKAGLQPGDRLEAINGKTVDNMVNAIEFIHKSSGKLIRLTIGRGMTTFDVSITPKYDPKMKVGLIGFSPKPIYKKYGPILTLWKGIEGVVGMIILTLSMLFALIAGKASIFDLVGPVGIAQMGGQVAHTGFIALLQFTAFLSTNLAIVNLLPIPALDGGRLVFVLIEGLRGKAIDIKKENRIHYIGLIVLLALLLLITLNDILRIIRR